MTTPANLFLAAITLFLLSKEVRSRPGQSFELSSESSLERNNTDEDRQLAIANFKSKVLKSLKLPQPPHGNFTNHRLSNKMIQLVQEEEKEVSRTEPKENMIVYHSNSDLTCLKGNGTFCQKYDFHIVSTLESVISIHAYFHKILINERLILSIYADAPLEKDPLIKLREDSSKSKNISGWVTFELPKNSALKTENSSLLCSLEIEGSKVDTDGEESPFLVVTQHTEIVEPKKRVARSSNENCTCCAENYHITLQDIGWQQWVLSPTEFDIKVCRGQCNESLSYFTINYQRIINSFYKVNKHLQRPGCNTWTPRCKAETYKELRMLYLGKDGTVFDQVISNMIIDSCKCM